MLRAPPLTATLGVRYTMGLASGHLALSSNVYYTSKFYFDPAGQLPQNHYATLELRAEWTDPSGKYSLAVYGDNVTGTKYLNQVYANSPGAPETWGAPATVAGELRARF